MNKQASNESRHVLHDPCCEAYVVFMVKGDTCTVAEVVHPDLDVEEYDVPIATGRDIYRRAVKAGLVNLRDQ